jgi:hypothetical protein
MQLLLLPVPVQLSIENVELMHGRVGKKDVLLPAMSIFILDAVAQIVLPSAKRKSAVSMMGRLPII